MSKYIITSVILIGLIAHLFLGDEWTLAIIITAIVILIIFLILRSIAYWLMDEFDLFD